MGLLSNLAQVLPKAQPTTGPDDWSRRYDDPPNPFLPFWELGYRRLVPIIPPGASIAEKSSLARRVGTSADSRGKAPGLRGRDGEWRGFDWVKHETTEDDLERWSIMGAGVGIKTGDQGDGTSLVAIDADTLDKAHANTIYREVVKLFGFPPIRIGLEPKALYVVRVRREFDYSRVDFNDTLPPERVELLSDGRQFVAQGIHPRTAKPYDWRAPLVAFDNLAVHDADRLSALLESLRLILPAAREIVTEGNGAPVDQDVLRGELATVTAAVSALPNTSALFPTRDDHRNVGIAIKAALPDHPAEAFELFTSWSDKWDGTDSTGTISGNTPDYLDAEWRRYKAPFRRGASWIYELAEKHGGWTGRDSARAERWFDADAATVVALEAPGPTPAPRPPLKATPFRYQDALSFPRRQCLYGKHYFRSYLSATVAPGGVGKSSLAITEALALVSGRPLLRVPVARPVRVWLWNGEDPLEETERRVLAAMKHYGLTQDDIQDRLLIDSGREVEIVIARQERDGAKLTDVRDAIAQEIRVEQIDVLVIDPLVSAHRVNENDNNAVDIVAKSFAWIADQTGAAIEVVHHTRKLRDTGGEVTPEDSRGASALVAAARSVRTLVGMTPAEARPLGLSEGEHRSLFRFGGSKSNLAPQAADDGGWLRLIDVGLGNAGFAADGLYEPSDQVGVVTAFELSPVAADVETALADAITQIQPGRWRRDVRAGEAWIGQFLGPVLNLDPEIDRRALKSRIDDLFRRNWLRAAPGMSAQRKPKVYVEQGLQIPTVKGGVFE